ncbi:MAG: tRNA (guanosine(37)-N1)-methyltransferase TrmD [Lachnospiraceae bacterium]|nr:tRNA (guanosine(37)-N1)-methyltransferase TrmD [Lachnospiraceae bacterium]
MRFHVLTLFPDMIEEGAHNSILARAMDKGLIGVEAVNIRDYTQNKHGRVDDYIYGGGAGLLMQAQPVYDAWEALSGKIREERGEDASEQRPVRTVYLSPQGKVFSQEIAEELSREENLILLCGHYEGIDERVLEEIVTDEISIGDYVLTGGELPALVLIDAVSRLVPGVLGNDVSAETDSFQDGLLEYPQYSRPEEWRGKKVPPILLSGDHAKVDAWRKEQSVQRTKERRPDLYEKYLISLEHPEEM